MEASMDYVIIEEYDKPLRVVLGPPTESSRLTTSALYTYERGKGMDEAGEQEHLTYPLMRVFTFGEFALERLVPSPGNSSNPPCYMQVAPEERSSRGPAMKLLKVLLCRANRRATREELIEAIWHDSEHINTVHSLDSAASVLRRHILRTHEGESLLLTMRESGGTSFKLPVQRRLWVDADAFLSLAAKAVRAESQGQDPLPLLEAAHALARGEFLEDDVYSEWAQGRRLTINGARHRVLYKLAELYLKEQRVSQAEELLFAFLEEKPTDEDVLCRLMILLAERGRRQEALEICQYTVDVLREENMEPAPHTKELARRIRHGNAVREAKTDYTTISQAIVPLTVPVEQPAKRKGRMLRFGRRRV
jgi:DNA-binding SARP family transcriptional activator